MYLPPVFGEDDPARLGALTDAHSFATVIAVDDAGVPEIAHLPCLCDPVDGSPRVVRFHVARGNPLVGLAESARPITVVFHGPHAYVSPRWYVEPAVRVPTWNYAVVHARGPSRVLSADELLALLAALTARHERGAERPWTMQDTSPGFLEKVVRGIVGIEVTVEDVQAKFKLSQNRDAVDKTRVRLALLARGSEDDQALAALMSPAPGLVMTPALKKAIELLQLSREELTKLVEEELAANPIEPDDDDAE